MDHLALTRNARGFVVSPELAITEDEIVVVHESSNAEEACVWLDFEGTSFELNAQIAYDLAEQLMAVVANHRFGDMRPARVNSAFVGGFTSFVAIPKVG